MRQDDFPVEDYADGNKTKVMTLDAVEVIRRFPGQTTRRAMSGVQNR
jgi:hypothetical protein